MSGGSQTALSVAPFNLLNRMGRDVILIQLFKMHCPDFSMLMREILCSAEF